MTRGGLVRTLGLSAVLGVLAATAAAGDEDPYASPRAGMVALIQAHAAAYSSSLGEISAPVIEAMGRTPRHHFVPESVRGAAYEDRPLAIGYGQTISQPYIVALMSDLLAIRPGDTVLEVGTGSGYQAAVLAEARGAYLLHRNHSRTRPLPPPGFSNGSATPGSRPASAMATTAGSSAGRSTPLSSPPRRAMSRRRSCASSRRAAAW